MLSQYRQHANQESARIGAFRRGLQFGLNLIYIMFTALSVSAAYLFGTWLRYPLMSFAALGDIVGFKAALSALRNANNRHWRLWRDLFIEVIKLGLITFAVILPFVGDLCHWLAAKWSSSLLSSLSNLSHFAPFATPLFAIALGISWLQQAWLFYSTWKEVRQLKEAGAHLQDENHPDYKAYQAALDRLTLHRKLFFILGFTLAGIILSAGLLGAAPPLAIAIVCTITAVSVGLDMGHSTKGSLFTRVAIGLTTAVAASLFTHYLPEIAAACATALGLSIPAVLATAVAIAAVIFIAKAFYDRSQVNVPSQNEIELVTVKTVAATSPQQERTIQTQVAVNPARIHGALCANSATIIVKKHIEDANPAGAKSYLLQEISKKISALQNELRLAWSQNTIFSNDVNIYSDKIRVLERAKIFVQNPNTWLNENDNAKLASKTPRALDAFRSSDGGEVEHLLKAAEMYAKYCCHVAATATPSIMAHP